MVRSRRVLPVLLLLCMTILAGCGFNYPGKAYFDRLAAERRLAASVELIKKETPLIEIDRHETIGPPQSPRVFYGRDKEGRPLAAWVSVSGESVYGHLYLDSGVTREQAMAKAEEAGYQVDWGPVLVGPQKPFWKVQAHQEPGSVYFLHVDQSTGELTVKKNGG